ncbi:putative membrane protein [Novipirellula aureliae]|uniref:Putative membrane protein n=1 Tax=Novipirellula aureliae TaxID=2527966 RepID=A0A5C6EA23_9BACT|nr:tellurite resistance/C4-dicarboxylate transporter family protein [Novipirellula aureliae]TWU45862.1 putative membrane protein [Novipirellula aureliae]
MTNSNDRLSANKTAIADLNPAYFALVMATGIVSIASHLMGHLTIAIVLLWINTIAFAILWALTLFRLAIFPRKFFADLVDHRRGVGFFTSVAGTCVLGSQYLLVMQSRSVAVVLWIIGITLWFVLTYTIFTSYVIKEVKPTLADGIHGGWLVAVVATQSVSLLGSTLAEGFGSYQPQTLFFALTMWLGGGMLYIWIISLIFFRYAFLPMKASDLSPPYWINMGAMAISTLAGVMLVSAVEGSSLLSDIEPFLKGFTLFFWATATWWIPMLLTLGVWRHIYKRYQLRYDPQYWGLVFPLGMYTTCTYRMMTVFELPYLSFITAVFLWIALVVWSITFIGMFCHLFRAANLPIEQN